MAKALSDQAKKKFVKKLEESLSDAIARYAVVRDGETIRYQDFTIRKEPDSTYTCVKDLNAIFKNIASIKIALLLCHNDIYKKSKQTRERLLESNKVLGKHKLDVMYYKQSLKHASSNRELYYTRLEESQSIINRETRKLDILIKAL
jgi:hypothetical protein